MDSVVRHADTCKSIINRQICTIHCLFLFCIRFSGYVLSVLCSGTQTDKSDSKGKTLSEPRLRSNTLNPPLLISLESSIRICRYILHAINADANSFPLNIFRFDSYGLCYHSMYCTTIIPIDRMRLPRQKTKAQARTLIRQRKTGEEHKIQKSYGRVQREDCFIEHKRERDLKRHMICWIVMYIPIPATPYVNRLHENMNNTEEKRENKATHKVRWMDCMYEMKKKRWFSLYMCLLLAAHCFRMRLHASQNTPPAPSSAPTLFFTIFFMDFINTHKWPESSSTHYQHQQMFNWMHIAHAQSYSINQILYPQRTVRYGAANVWTERENEIRFYLHAYRIIVNIDINETLILFELFYNHIDFNA